MEFRFKAWGAYADRYDRATDQKNDSLPALFVFNGNFNGEMVRFCRKMTDLVITHLNQPWGPSRTLATKANGDSWRPLATLGDMLENVHFPQKGRQGSPRVAKVQEGPQGWLR